MHTCSICQSDTELDDVVLTLSTGGCICLGCYCRETDSTKPMSAGLRQAVEQALTQPDPPASSRPSEGVTPLLDHDAGLFPRNWKPWWQARPRNG